MELARIFSLLFFAVFVAYYFLGIYILTLNIKSTMHWVFFAFCFALCLWAFGFCMAISAPDYAASLFWRRISAIGWGSFFSIQLHFILILTGHNNWLQKKWRYILLYLPAVMIVWVFGLSDVLTAQQYNLINTSAGWVNVSVNRFWDSLFNLYYAGFTIIGIGLIWRWGASKAGTIRKQARLMVGSYALALLAGTMTEIVINSFFAIKIPQIAPVIILLPVSVIFYCIRQYGLMSPESKSQVADAGQVLSEASRSRLYSFLTQAYLLGAFMNFVSQYLIFQQPLKLVLPLSIALLFLGHIFQLILWLNIRTDYKDALFSILVTVSIPLIILQFIRFASVSIWAAPIVPVMIAVAFDRRGMLFSIGTVSFLTYLWIWVKVPSLNVQIDGSDHIIRIGLMGIFIWIAAYINRIYFQRLTENEEQVKYQKLLSQISSDFVTASAGNIDQKIKAMLQQCGEYFQADRSYLFLFADDQETMIMAHKWCGIGMTDSQQAIGEVTAASLPLFMEQIRERKIVHIPEMTVELLETATGSGRLLARQIKSLIAMPVMNNERVIGFLGVDTVRAAKIWRKDHQEMLKVLANLLADALGKVDAEKEINYMAYYDNLTRLANRTLFKNRLEQAIGLARRSEKLIGVVLVDLDSFKAVNDSMGHDGGDALLVEIAKRLSAFVRQNDTVARMGGDEFLIMIPQIPQPDDIRIVIEKIITAFHQPMIVKNQEFFVTASVGIAVYPFDGEDTDALVKHADLAMYSAKEKGKNRYTFCSAEMKNDFLVSMELTNSLYRAQERDELMLYYQPQVNAHSGEIIGLEALIRWNHPQKGIISPGMFIPLAEKTGLINPVGQWVLQTACRQNKAWQDMGLPPTRMAVNISVGQFRNPNLVSVVAEILKDTQLDPAYLELEITESIAVNEPEYIINTLNELKALGLTISIDDFGTEYSSLSRLKSLPIDRIKMDMQFVHGIAKSRKDEGIIRVIFQLGRSLGLKVIAEGVENQQQLMFLQDSLCDEIQGFYFFKPMPAEEVEVVLRKMHTGRDVSTNVLELTAP